MNDDKRELWDEACEYFFALLRTFNYSISCVLDLYYMILP